MTAGGGWGRGRGRVGGPGGDGHSTHTLGVENL